MAVSKIFLRISFVTQRCISAFFFLICPQVGKSPMLTRRLADSGLKLIPKGSVSAHTCVQAHTLLTPKVNITLGL